MAKLNYDSFLDLFPTSPRRKAGNGVLVICSAHDDHVPSLWITPPKGGDFVADWTCQAGCTKEAVLKSKDLKWADVLVNGHKPTDKHIVTTYPYHDINGKLIYEVVRYEPKDFDQRRPDGNGGYIKNLKGVTPTLYHLPEVVKAVTNGDAIYIAEGEKDVDNLWAYGFVATCNSGGAGHFRPEFAQYLSGASQVVVIADKDSAGKKFAGQRHADSICRLLIGKVKSLKYIEFPGDTVKDFSDWIAAGGDDLQLKALAEVTPEYTPTTASQSTPVIRGLLTSFNLN